MKVCRRSGGINSGMPNAPAGLSQCGGTPASRAHEGLGAELWQ